MLIKYLYNNHRLSRLSLCSVLFHKAFNVKRQVRKSSNSCKNFFEATNTAKCGLDTTVL